MALALGIGIVMDDCLTVPLLAWAGLSSSAWVLAVVLLSRQCPRLLTSCLLLAVVGAGGLRYHQSTRLSPPDHVRNTTEWGEPGLLTGRVDGEPELRGEGDERRLRFLLRAESWCPQGSTARSLTGRILVTLREPHMAATGANRLRLRCRLSRPQPARNPGAFDYRRFLALQGIHATAAVAPGDVVSFERLDDTWWRQGLVNPLRGSARRILSAHLSGAPAGLLRGMLLGDGFAIPAEVAGSFRATGLAHALVISGLHVGLVALFFFTTFRFLQLPPAPAYVLTTAVLVLYAFVTDLQAPVVRSTVMAGIVMVGRSPRPGR